MQRLITEVLQQLGLYSHAALWQLLGTAAVESDLGRELYQYRHGPGRGLFSIEPATETWLCKYTYRHPYFRKVLKSFTPVVPGGELALTWNFAYQVVLARLRYWVVPEPLPSDLRGYAKYWDNHYNCNKVDEQAKFIRRFKKYFGDIR